VVTPYFSKFLMAVCSLVPRYPRWTFRPDSSGWMGRILLISSFSVMTFTTSMITDSSEDDLVASVLASPVHVGHSEALVNA